ncbi:hypothetical protein MTO96_046937 [Rhipicephalus appendiculatus]
MNICKSTTKSLKRARPEKSTAASATIWSGYSPRTNIPILPVTAPAAAPSVHAAEAVTSMYLLMATPDGHVGTAAVSRNEAGLTDEESADRFERNDDTALKPLSDNGCTTPCSEDNP